MDMPSSSITAVLGQNGAGKTTSFYMIVGLVSPDQGDVYLDDQKITRSAMYKRAQMGIGYLPQEVSVFRKMSVENNIRTVLEMTDLSKQEQADKLEALIDEFGLNHVRHNRGDSLSGGEKRRTEIARALATDPKFILLDEPFAGVDPIAVEDIQYIVSHLKDRNIGVLITDHNVQETLAITDRTYLLFEGAILRSGTAEELAADPQVRKVYLGQNFELRKVDHRKKREEKSVNEFKSDSEKSGHYIGNILNLAKKTQNRLNTVKRFRYAPTYARTTGVDELVDRASELKEYFLDVELGSRGREIVRYLKFGPLKAYSRSYLGEKLDIIIAYIPLIGWPLIINSLIKRRKCKNDLELFISNLESLKTLVENPEMEKML